MVAAGFRQVARCLRRNVHQIRISRPQRRFHRHCQVKIFCCYSHTYDAAVLLLIACVSTCYLFARQRYIYQASELVPLPYAKFPTSLGSDTVRLIVIPLAKASAQLVKAVSALSRDFQQALRSGMPFAEFVCSSSCLQPVALLSDKLQALLMRCMSCMSRERHINAQCKAGNLQLDT